MALHPLKTTMAGGVPLNRPPRLPTAPAAAALFAVAEAASGAAVAGALAEVITTVTPLARSAQITYLKPARGAITASARLDCDAVEMMAKLDADGKADFAVAVDLTDGQGV